ncbi:MAG TPA: AMP-binding protein, partial [Streptomyces sp.]|nr:AMP-binding protein [Streptomyces sp.]
MREFTVPAVAPTPQVGGLADAVFDYATEDPDRVALCRKDAAGEWQDITAADFRDQVMAVAKGLLAEGVRFGDRVALMARTRYEWTLIDFSLWAIGAHVVPIYPTSSAEQVCWMMHDAEVSAAIV